ncbi:MAG: DUF4129 domain-containing protein [Thermoplasmata archaeon]
MASAPTSTRSNPALWLVALAIAFLIGGAAAFLSGTFGTGPGSGQTVYEPSNQLLGWIALGLGIAFLGYLIFDRVRSETLPVPTRIVVTVLVVLLIMVLFVVVGRFVSGGGGGFQLTYGPSTNSTSPTQNISFGNTTNQSVGTGGIYSLGNFAVPAWVEYALLGAVLVMVGTISARLFAHRMKDQSDDEPDREQERDDLRAALTRAANALDDPNADPRRVLESLYAQLLLRIESLAGDLRALTPEEIRTTHLVGLGVRSDAAERITRLFERARYSSHPIAPSELVEARSALREAIADLDRRGAAP